jgi:hypothetical protein
MGAVLDALSAGLKMLPSVVLTELPRMDDFGVWGEAVCRGIGREPGAFLKAYTDNREQASEAVLEAYPVATHLRAMIDECKEWEGIARELLASLEARAGEKAVVAKGWPRSPRALSGTLRRLAPELRKVGVDVVFDHRENHTGARKIQITLVTPEKARDSASPPSPASPDGHYPSSDSGMGGDSGQIGLRHPPSPASEFASPAHGGDGDFASPDPGLASPTVTLNPGKNGAGDDGDGGDARKRPLSGREVYEL